jgi:hypothetical protein
MALRLMRAFGVSSSGRSTLQLSVANAVRGFVRSPSSKFSPASVRVRPDASLRSLDAFRGGIIETPRLASVASLRQFGSDTSTSALKICNPCIADVFRYAFEEPRILCSFLNSALDFNGDQRIESIEYLPQELPSSDPSSPVSYRFTVVVRCRSKDGRHFLIQMQNDFRDDYHLKCLIELCRMTGRLDSAQTLEDQTQRTEKNKSDRLKYWKDIQGLYSIVITNKSFPLPRFNSLYTDEAVMEPFLVTAYELRHVKQLERRFGNVPNQIVILMIDRLEKEAAGLTTSIERWSYVFQNKNMRSGAAKILETKTIEQPAVIAGDDEAILAFFDRLNIEKVPRSLRERYLSDISYFNDSIIDIRDQGFNEGLEKGVKNVATRMLKSGMPVPDIMALTGLSAQQIESS